MSETPHAVSGHDADSIQRSFERGGVQNPRPWARRPDAGGGASSAGTVSRAAPPAKPAAGVIYSRDFRAFLRYT